MSKMNLWGDSLAAEEIKTPYIILREQSELLGQQTSQVLEGSLVIESLDYQQARYIYLSTPHIPNAQLSQKDIENSFYYRFDIISRALGNYIYTLMRVIQPVNLYPTIIINSNNDELKICIDEEQFIENLRGILSSSNTKRVIAGLLSQSKAIR